MTALFAAVFRMPLTRGTGSPGPAHRIRTVLLHPVSRTSAVEEHVSVRLPARKHWSQLADVLIEHGTGAARAAETAVSHPGALVVAVHHGSRCWLRLGAAGTVLALEAAGPGHPEDLWAPLASLAHAWLVAGLPAADFGSAVPYGVDRLRFSCFSCFSCVGVRGAQVSDASWSSLRSRCRADCASSDCDRPTEE